MKISLEGKSAMVGGSSKGIGFGIAKQLAESGASVCLMARDEKKMKSIRCLDLILWPETSCGVLVASACPYFKSWDFRGVKINRDFWRFFSGKSEQEKN